VSEYADKNTDESLSVQIFLSFSDGHVIGYFVVGVVRIKDDGSWKDICQMDFNEKDEKR
jgi:hypothetical protein